MAEDNTTSSADQTYTSGSVTAAHTQTSLVQKVDSVNADLEGNPQYPMDPSTQAQSIVKPEPVLDEAERIQNEITIYGSGKPRRVKLRARIKPDET